MSGSTLVSLTFSASQQANLANYWNSQGTSAVFANARQALQQRDSADYNTLNSIVQGNSVTDTLTLSDTAQALMAQLGLANLLSFGMAGSGTLTAGSASQPIAMTLTATGSGTTVSGAASLDAASSGTTNSGSTASSHAASHVGIDWKSKAINEALLQQATFGYTEIAQPTSGTNVQTANGPLSNAQIGRRHLQITATLAQGQSAGTEANSTTDEQGSGSLVSRFYQIPLDLYTNGSDNEGVDILHTLLNQASWTQVATANTGSSNFKVTV